jgi:hypothetical protein
MNNTVNIINTKDWPCGQRIVAIRTMTDAEMKKEGWQRHHWQNQNPTCIELEDASVLYASCDEEGNNSGVFFGYSGEINFTINLSKEEA